MLSSCATPEGRQSKNKKDYLVTIHTSYGDMKAILYDETPLHKTNFIELAKSGQYDSTIFHRVINQFMIQGGGIDRKDNIKNEDRIPAEFVKELIHTKGALAAARQPDRINPEKASSWCQFYIVHGKKYTEQELTLDQRKLNQAISQLFQYKSHADLKAQFMALQAKGDMEAMNQLALENCDLAEKELNIQLRKNIPTERLKAYTEIGGAPHLDDEYTVFGQVIEGLDVIDKIATVQTATGDQPIEDLYLTIEVEKLSRKKISKIYGYEYPDR